MSHLSQREYVKHPPTPFGGEEKVNRYEVIIENKIWKNIKASSLRVAVNKAFKSFEYHHNGKKRKRVNIEARLLEKNI